MAELRRGDVVADRYEIRREIGRGGFAAVFEADDRHIGRTVALKVLHADRATGTVPARFAREIQVAAQLTSPHTVLMFDHGTTASGDPFIVFEHLAGKDLTAHAASGQMNPKAVIEIVRQVALALREAHQAGIVHRDLKPGNIRILEHVDEHVVLKVMDFGIAAVRPDPTKAQLTADGQLLGTPSYMAPEQLEALPSDPRTDIYALGLIAHDALMGRKSRPAGRFADQLYRLEPDHHMIVDAVTPLHRRLGAVIARMTANDPQKRYPNVDALLSALDELARPASMPRAAQEVAPTAQPWRSVSIGLAIFVVAAVLILVLVPPPPPTSAPAPRRHVPSAAAPATRPDAQSAATGSADALTPPAAIDGECGPRDRLQGWVDLETTHVYVPPSYEPHRRAPVLFLFHDDAETPDTTLDNTGLADAADKHGWVIVAPTELQAGMMLSVAWSQNARTVQKLPLVWESANEALCLDKDRVVTLGVGAGGNAAMLLPCTVDLTVRGLATTAFRFVDRSAQLCETYKPTAHLHFAQLADLNMPAEGGKGCGLFRKLSLQEHEEIVRKANACSQHRAARDEVHEEGQCFDYASCKAPFTTCHVRAGRGWPGSRPRNSLINRCDGEPGTFPYADIVSSFFLSVL